MIISYLQQIALFQSVISVDSHLMQPSAIFSRQHCFSQLSAVDSHLICSSTTFSRQHCSSQLSPVHNHHIYDHQLSSVHGTVLVSYFSRWPSHMVISYLQWIALFQSALLVNSHLIWSTAIFSRQYCFSQLSPVHNNLI